MIKAWSRVVDNGNEESNVLHIGGEKSINRINDGLNIKVENKKGQKWAENWTSVNEKMASPLMEVLNWKQI